MSRFQFTQRCRSNGELRIGDAISFMTLMQEAFQVSSWIDSEDRTVDLVHDSIESALRSKVSDSDFKRFGVTWVVKSNGNEAPIVLKMAMGGDEWSPNFFTTDFSRTSVLPDLQFFKRAIQSIRPFESFILDENNERELRRELSTKPRSEVPLILRWFHYMDSSLVDLVGGVQRCVETPAFKVDPFCDGVLFQLTEAAFEADNPQHKRLQLAAMRHLGLK